MPEIIVKLGERIIHRYYFDKDSFSVGRARDNDIVIENLSVSRNHCRMKKQDGKYIMTDLNSANGTLVNGVKITKAEVFHNDIIAVGKHNLVFVDGDTQGVPSHTPTDGVAFAGSSLEGLVGVLTVTKGKQAGQEFRILKDETFIGRAPESDIRLHDWFVSKKHAAIKRDGENYMLKDLDSWRGTTINGHSVKEVELKDDDEVVFGTTVLKFNRLSAEELAKQPARPAPASSPLESDGPPPPEVAEQVAHEELAPQDDAEDFLSPHDEVADDAESGLIVPDVSSVETYQDDVHGEQEKLADDEFAPFTEDELEALEAEADVHDNSHEENMDDRRLAWEDVEAEKMFEMGEEEDSFSLIESEEELRNQEEPPTERKEAIAGLEERGKSQQPDEAELLAEDAEEEAALEPVGDAGDSGIQLEVEAPPKAKKEKKEKKEKQAEESPAPQPDDSAVKENAAVQKEVTMWEKALKNKSALIRKNAAKELKKLTGRDYDWQSEPTGT